MIFQVIVWVDESIKSSNEQQNSNKMAKYDAAKRQWESLEPSTFDNHLKFSSLGQQILDLLSKHGPKVAQVSKHICAV